jgi:glycosyltransferase involved in cell wall biosynthesis
LAAFYEKIICDEGDDIVGQIINKTIIQQTIDLDKNSLFGISLKFGTFQKKLSSRISILLEDSRNKNIKFNYTLECSKILDCSWNNIFFPEHIFKNSSQITITVKPLDSKINDAPTLFYNAEKYGHHIKIWERKIQGSLLLKLFYKKPFTNKENVPSLIKKEFKLSICCITYNHEEFIKDTLDGFLKQKADFDFEVLIIDDGSIDKTPDIIKSYESAYPDIIKATYNPFNTCAEKSFVNVLSQVKSKYVALCEGDDYWASEYKLQKQIDFLENNKDYSICFHPVLVTGDKNHGSDYIFPLDRDESKFNLENLIKANFIQTNSVVYRWAFDKKNIKQILPDDILPGDWFLHLLHADKGKIGFLNEVMSVYRRHENGIWHGGVDAVVKKYGLQKAKFFNQLNIYFKNKYSDSFLERENHLLKKYHELNAEKIKISIIIPTYNHENYIEKCIESVLAQRGYFDLEVIVGNDASSDKTRSLISKYKNIKIINHPKNLGLLKNIKECFKHCSGTYIAFCEGDDYWTSPYRIQNMLNYLEKNKNLAGCFNLISIEDETNGFFRDHPIQAKLENNQIIGTYDLLEHNYISNYSCTFYRKSCLDKFMPNLPESSDWIFNIFVSMAGGIGFIKQKSSVWRMHDKGKWGSLSDQEKNKVVIEMKDKIKKIFNF